MRAIRGGGGLSIGGGHDDGIVNTEVESRGFGKAFEFREKKEDVQWDPILKRNRWKIS